MGDMSFNDLVQLYEGCLCMYKDEVVKITKCSPEFTVNITYLEHGKKANVKFDMEMFSAPLSRIGFVNHGHMAFYMRRAPRRQWAVGITPNNVLVNWPNLKFAMGDNNPYQLIKEVNKLDLKCISNSIKGVYPSYAEAQKAATEHKGMYAFDRQFAVDGERNIYYKLDHIGVMPKTAKHLEAIKFLDGFDYLQIPLLQHYEKTIRTFAG